MRYEVSAIDQWGVRRSLGRETSRNAAENVANNLVMILLMTGADSDVMRRIEVLDTKRNEVVFSRTKELGTNRFGFMWR